MIKIIKQTRAMGFGNHLKNRVSSKSLLSKGTKMIYSIFILAVFFLSSCRPFKDVYAMYQTDSARTGQVVIIPSEPTIWTSVTLNDKLIVKDANILSVRIGNVPEGYATISYTSDNSSYKEKLDQEMTVNVIRGKETTKLIQVPPRSSGSWISGTLWGLAGVAVLILILTQV